MSDSAEEEMSEDREPLQKDLTCPVCQGIFRDPVLLPCTHSFCRECLESSMKFNKRCPLCRKDFEEGLVIANRALSDACETYLKTKHTRPKLESGGEDCCNLHLKPLELYCEKDEEPVCVDCVSLHSTHRLLSLRDGAPVCKVRWSHLLPTWCFGAETLTSSKNRNISLMALSFRLTINNCISTVVGKMQLLGLLQMHTKYSLYL